MTPEAQHPVDWNGGADDTPWGAGSGHRAEDATQYPAASGPDGHPGPDLLGFLHDFRTASFQEAEAATGDPTSLRRRSVAAIGPEELDDETASDADDPYAGCDVPIAADWWLASDGRWYPPELHPDFRDELPVEALTEPEIDERPAAAASVPVDGLGRPRRRSPWSRRLLARSPMPQAC